MFVNYVAKPYENTVCTKCYNLIQGVSLPRNVDIWVDGLPVGYEKKFLEECVTYCPSCGQIVINASHLQGYNKIAKTEPHLDKKEVLDAVYQQYANKYVQGIYQEFCGELAQAYQNKNMYLSQFDDETYLNSMTLRNKLECADIYRTLGRFKEASKILKSINAKKIETDICKYLYTQERAAIQSENISRIIIPVALTRNTM